ncbi:GNAT family N-acetyltransferase [Hydrogenoanaerobacterium sp.]|uniref:GNAT family N-acetyltransferase n=1 Tax=Hydrogenoanaerobacterium sp. TaxID=2953763 RepID=UPI00289A4318|nr:GNAT family N-acetyltransferase [Hydrogenoanaerobacterium sp.]
MTVRSITPADRELYIELSKEFYSGEATLHPANLDHINRTFDECVKGSPYAKAFIIEEDGKTAGFALFSFTWSNESGGLVLWLEELCVLPAFRGLRLGTQFMDWMMEEYKDISRIRLEVCRCNDGARRLYERFGFKLLDYEQLVWDKEDH